MSQEYVIRTPDQVTPVLRGFRRLRQLNQEQVATELGISQKSYSALELNASRTSVARLMAALAALDVELVLRDRRTGETVSAEQVREW
ncbi:helix-turn-helix domain-containing protein [Thiohalomonas denitrificans]|uniref:helix-turn-helix domain-containing protein n=1 Tax=Thiohalomonas denitrificans TaxID=415747 RepID=UPI0026F2DAC7|nr:helix-turn-helix domain-containing protein [Thiohalomonas denitrificans]